jgi:DNA-directed RNA polymerase specialized sigma24 family protein
MHQMDDSTMLTALKGGDIKAYRYFFMKYYRPLCLKARVILNGIEESEQVVQHVFVQVWEEKLYMSVEQCMGGYLYKLVHNSCMNLVKGRSSTEGFSPDQGLLLMQQVMLPLQGGRGELSNGMCLSLWSEEHRDPRDFSQITEKGVKLVKLAYKFALSALRSQTRTRL